MAYDNTVSPRLEIVKGSTKDYIVWFTDSSNNAMNLSGYTGMLYAKRFPVRETSGIDISVGLTILDATLGYGQFSFSKTDTSVAERDYQFQIELDNGSNLIITGGDRITIVSRVNS